MRSTCNSLLLVAIGVAGVDCGGPASDAPQAMDAAVADATGPTGANAEDAPSSRAEASQVTTTSGDGRAQADDAAGAMDATRSEAGTADAAAHVADADALDANRFDGADALAKPLADAGPACGNAILGGGPVSTSTTHLDIGVHDPSMIWDGTNYFLFATGGTLGVRKSPDIRNYSNAGNIFDTLPAWITTTLGANPGGLWAPDVSYFNGAFHVYYAGSTFGSNDSVIGLATTTSLESPHWVDQGLVVRSTKSDDFNAIDPNVSFDAECTPWLAFGSFWDGIKMRQLDATMGMPAAGNAKTYSLASRGGGAIEASSIVSHDGFYYLFVSFDACCKGVNSTYRTMVGRATSITGPYTDKAGHDMMSGAAEQLLATTGRYIGPGGGTAWKDGDRYLYVFHYYDGDDNGASKLQIRPIDFDSSDWPVLGDPLFP